MSGNNTQVHVSIHHQIGSAICCPLLFLISTCLTFPYRLAAVIYHASLCIALFFFVCDSLINLKVASPSERVYILLFFVVFNKHLFNFPLQTCCGHIMHSPLFIYFLCFSLNLKVASLALNLSIKSIYNYYQPNPLKNTGFNSLSNKIFLDILIAQSFVDKITILCKKMYYCVV